MRRLTDAEISAAEAAVGRPLPELYRRLLAEVGYGSRGQLQIYHPAVVRELYEPFFDDPARLFTPYFPIGCDNELQEVWAIDASTQRAASIGHETVPDDGPDEKWLGYEEWFEQHLGVRRGP